MEERQNTTSKANQDFKSASSSNMDKTKIMSKKPPVAIPATKSFLATELKMKFAQCSSCFGS